LAAPKPALLVLREKKDKERAGRAAFAGKLSGELNAATIPVN